MAVIRIDEAANAVILMPAHAVPALAARPDLRATPDDVPDLDPGDAGSDALRGAADFVPDDERVFRDGPALTQVCQRDVPT